MAQAILNGEASSAVVLTDQDVRHAPALAYHSKPHLLSIGSGPMSNQTNKLKPCPFCGAEYDFNVEGFDNQTEGHSYLSVICRVCSCSGPIVRGGGPQAAIARWNMRMCLEAKAETADVHQPTYSLKDSNE